MTHLSSMPAVQLCSIVILDWRKAREDELHASELQCNYEVFHCNQHKRFKAINTETYVRFSFSSHSEAEPVACPAGDGLRHSLRVRHQQVHCQHLTMGNSRSIQRNTTTGLSPQLYRATAHDRRHSACRDGKHISPPHMTRVDSFMPARS